MFEVQALPRKLEAALVDVKDPKAKVRMSAVRDLVQYAQWESGAEAAAATWIGSSSAETTAASESRAVAQRRL